MNFTSRWYQGISDLGEHHHGGNCSASIVKFLKSRKLCACVHLHRYVYTGSQRIYRQPVLRIPAERCTYMRGVVTPQKLGRLSDELACVSSTKMPFIQLLACVRTSSTTSTLLLWNLGFHNSSLNGQTRMNKFTSKYARQLGGVFKYAKLLTRFGACFYVDL